MIKPTKRQQPEVEFRRRTPEETQAVVDAAGFIALERDSKKHADRELLPAGETISIDLAVKGHVGGHPFKHEVIGELQIGHDQTTGSTSGPDTPHLVAYLLEQLGPKRRQQLVVSLADHYAKHAELPAVAQETLSAAQTLLSRLRTTKTVEKKGNVRFEPARPK